MFSLREVFARHKNHRDVREIEKRNFNSVQQDTAYSKENRKKEIFFQ
jgi:hypothetical protein